ncbi:hypothetical protein G6F68_018837 [Rhizopus microsporus]|nr:hypothetical protein G6F68_018837 [Rhizopus microsporus]
MQHPLTMFIIDTEDAGRQILFADVLDAKQLCMMFNNIDARNGVLDVTCLAREDVEEGRRSFVARRLLLLDARGLGLILDVDRDLSFKLDFTLTRVSNHPAEVQEDLV